MSDPNAVSYRDQIQNNHEDILELLENEKLNEHLNFFLIVSCPSSRSMFKTCALIVKQLKNVIIIITFLFKIFF